MSQTQKVIKAAPVSDRRQTVAEIVDKYRETMKRKMRWASPAKNA